MAVHQTIGGGVVPARRATGEGMRVFEHQFPCDRNFSPLIAGADGTGPGAGGGTIVFAALAPPVTVTVAPVTIAYNPVSYAAPTDFATKFGLTEGRP
ncbi:MAG: hypothetical protein ABIW83_00720 [Allosphingosinicella sp.]